MNNDLRSSGERASQEKRSADGRWPNTLSGNGEPRAGSIIAGRFQIDKLIARGGMSTVYLAHQLRLNRPVALKVLTPPPSTEEAVAFEQRFLREGQTLASLEHPNIVVLYDYGETEDARYYLAMEFIDGPRLSDVLKEGPLPVDRALNIIVQVAAGLRYAHKRGVVHRDLKPSNLLVRFDEDGREHVKIVDFGLVKLTEADQNITRAGLILGSPHCMAPEQVKGLDVDHRADIYALGVLMFRSLTGQYPFHGTNSAATMVAHLNHPIPTFYSVAPELEVPPGLEDVVRRCLAKSPGERYRDMREVIAALAPLMDAPPEGIRSMGSTSSSSSSSMLRQALGSQSGVFAPVIVPVEDRHSARPWMVLALGSLVLFFLLAGVGVGALAVSGLMHLQPETTAVAPARVEGPGVTEPAKAPSVEAPVPTVRIANDEPRAIAPERPARAAAPRQAPAAPRTAPAKKTGPTQAEANVKAPEGYMGLPEDLIE